MADEQTRVHLPEGETLGMKDRQPAGTNGESNPGAAKPQHTTTVSQVPIPPFEKLANPGPLGLIGFAVTTFVLGLYECGAG